MAEILHVADRETWESAAASGAYRGATLDREGFLHNCTVDQLSGVLDRHFRGRSGLVLLRIETARLRAPLLWEASPTLDEDFPHLYGPLNVDAVTAVEPIEAPPG